MTLPLETLDDKTYAELVRDALYRIPLYAKGWTDFNPSDPGITILELLAWLSEMQIFRLDQVSNRSYLKYLYLMGDSGPEPPKAAEVEVLFSNLTSEGLTVEKGTQVYVTDPETGEETVFETRVDVWAGPGEGVSVWADEGVSFKDRDISFDGLPSQEIALPKAPVLADTLSLKVEGQLWSAVLDLDSSGPVDKDMVIDLAGGRLLFGDGVCGQIPIGSGILSYRSGGGARGNVPAGSLCQVKGDLSSQVSATNLLEASGGDDGESLADAISRVREGLKEVTRAVSPEDHEHLALQVKGVKRAKALPRYHPIHSQKVSRAVSVIVVPDVDDEAPMPSDELIKKVYWHLNSYRMLTTEVFVLPPVYIPVSIEVVIVNDPLYLKDSVSKAAKDELVRFLDPFVGGVDGDGWPFGRGVFISDIHKILNRVQGVDYVVSVILGEDTGGQDLSSEDLSIPNHGLVIAGEKVEVSFQEVTG